MRFGAVAGRSRLVSLCTSLPRLAADEPVKRLLYVVSPDAAGGRAARVSTFDVDNGTASPQIDLSSQGLRGRLRQRQRRRLCDLPRRYHRRVPRPQDGQGPLGKTFDRKDGAIVSAAPPTVRKSTSQMAPGRAPASGKSQRRDRQRTRPVQAATKARGTTRS